MAIVAADLLFKLSTKAGTAGNTLASTPGESLGTYISTTVITSGQANNLFDDITGAENAASTADYRCVFVHNNHGTLTLQSAVVYMSADPAGGATVALAVDPTAASALGATAAQALTADTETAPGAGVTGLTFVAADTPGEGLALGDIGPGQVKAFWVRRTATNSAPVTGETVSFYVQGDTAA